MILGDTCTRRCGFCNVKTGKPTWNDPLEPARVARSVARMGLRHAVITSVDRDDLPDYGASAFVGGHPPDPPPGAELPGRGASRPTSAARRCRSRRSSPSAPTSSTTTSRSSRACTRSRGAARSSCARCRVLRNAKAMGGDEVVTKSGPDGRARRDARRAGRDVRRPARARRPGPHRRPVPAPDRAPPARSSATGTRTSSRRSSATPTRSASTTSPPARSCASTYHADEHVPQRARHRAARRAGVARPPRPPRRT